jgi:hypothetical protein
MLKFLKIFYFLLGFVPLLSAQSFEGIIETKQVDANGLTNDISWYIKKDRIAFEIKGNNDKAPMKMRFIPQPKLNSMILVLSSPEGESKSEVHANDISSEIDMSRSEVKDNGVRNIQEYGEVNVLIITTPTTITETEVSKMIDINLSKYAAFFKNDYALLALIKSGQTGFPLNSVTKDKNGKVLSRTILISIRKTSVSETFFKTL